MYCFVNVQKPIGLLSLLDEESNFPRATDLTLANKLRQHLQANPRFKGEWGKGFSVGHYAGEVSSFSAFKKLRHLVALKFICCIFLIVKLILPFSYKHTSSVSF